MHVYTYSTCTHTHTQSETCALLGMLRYLIFGLLEPSACAAGAKLEGLVATGELFMEGENER